MRNTKPTTSDRLAAAESAARQRAAWAAAREFHDLLVPLELFDAINAALVKLVRCYVTDDDQFRAFCAELHDAMLPVFAACDAKIEGDSSE